MAKRKFLGTALLCCQRFVSFFLVVGNAKKSIFKIKTDNVVSHKSLLAIVFCSFPVFFFFFFFQLAKLKKELFCYYFFVFFALCLLQ